MRQMKDDFKPYRPRPAFVPVQAEIPAEQESAISSRNFGELGEFAVSSAEPNGELPEPAVGTDTNQKPSHHKPKGPKAWWHTFQELSRNKKIVIISALVGILIVVGGLFWYYVLKAAPAPPSPPPVAKQEEPPKPVIITSQLTGMVTTAELAALPTTGIMIENSPDARPQAGLYEAGVVFEAIAEGGITRFLALFQEAKPEFIGPVRSVRPYYLDFLAPFDAPIAHAGGSGQALAEVKAQGFKDLEAFQNPAYFKRVSNRYAPHNLYTGRSTLLDLQTKKGWSTSKFTGFVRKAEKKVDVPTAKSIDFSISGFLYNPHFDYDVPSNSYVRSMAGKHHVDERAKKPINPKVVVALVMTHRYAGIYSVYGATGSGAAYFFQDGTVTKGIWEKPSRKEQFRFGDANGSPLGLNPGQTWVSVVSSPGAVTYKP